MAVPSIGFSGIAMRFLFAFALVCFTWNPTRYNFVAWALAQWQNLGPLVAFSGLVLLSVILAAGMSWAHLRNRWSGQATVDDVDTN